jgi:integrase
VIKTSVSYTKAKRSLEGRDRRLATKEEKLISEYYIKYNMEMYYIFILALETAMRQSEILGLEWENIDFRRKRCIFYRDKKWE